MSAGPPRRIDELLAAAGLDPADGVQVVAADRLAGRRRSTRRSPWSSLAGDGRTRPPLPGAMRARPIGVLARSTRRACAATLAPSGTGRLEISTMRLAPPTGSSRRSDRSTTSPARMAWPRSALGSAPPTGARGTEAGPPQPAAVPARGGVRDDRRDRARRARRSCRGARRPPPPGRSSTPSSPPRRVRST